MSENSGAGHSRKGAGQLPCQEPPPFSPTKSLREDGGRGPVAMIKSRDLSRPHLVQPQTGRWASPLWHTVGCGAEGLRTTPRAHPHQRRLVKASKRTPGSSGIGARQNHGTHPAACCILEPQLGPRPPHPLAVASPIWTPGESSSSRGIPTPATSPPWSAAG